MCEREIELRDQLRGRAQTNRYFCLLHISTVHVQRCGLRITLVVTTEAGVAVVAPAPSLQYALVSYMCVCLYMKYYIIHVTVV